MLNTVWLSFDLGIRGDYEGLFEFLAEVEAKECGNNFAVFVFTAQDDLVTELKETLQKHVKLDKRSRIYAVYTKPEGKVTGAFLFGSRKAPQWTGYGAVGQTEEDVSV